MIGTGTITIQPPPTLPDDAMGLLRVLANPELAQMLLEHRKQWETAAQANAAVLKDIAKHKNVVDAQKRADDRLDQADAKLREAQERAEDIIGAANEEADDIVARAKAAHDGLDIKRKDIDARNEALQAHDAKLTRREADLDAREQALQQGLHELKERVREYERRKAAILAAATGG